MTTVNQPKPKQPTNKVLAFSIGLAIAKAIEIGVTSYWPALDDPTIWAPLPLLVEFIAPAVVGFIAAWRTKDAPNIDPYAPETQRGV